VSGTVSIKMALRIAFSKSRQASNRLYSGISPGVQINGTWTARTFNTLTIQRSECSKGFKLPQENIVAIKTSTRSYGSIYEPDYLDVIYYLFTVMIFSG